MAQQSADLAQLFASARLNVSLPPSASSAPQTIFFDELLKVNVKLSLPAHPRLPTSSNTPDTIPLPLARIDRAHVPALLVTLLDCLHVSLQTDYVAPNDPNTPAQKSANPHEPFASVQKQHSDYQLLPTHANHQQTASSVRAFAASWCGNQRANGPSSTLHAPNSKTTARDQAQHSADLSLEHDTWTVQWRCPVPINFIATPFEPLLAVTAALTLRLDPVHLRAPDSDAHLPSGFSHSLLTPLHEGPIYPDESRSQSVARATAASALGLDGPHGLGAYLAELPLDIIGGNSTIITPKTGSAALKAILRQKQDAIALETASLNSLQAKKAVDSNGDLADAAQPASNRSDLSEHTSLRIYKRSTREVLALKTGLNVRMRTLYTTHDPFQTSASPHLIHGRHDVSGNEASPTLLVLCVELENPFDSGIIFNVSEIKVRIHPTAASSAQSPQLTAKLLSYKTEDRLPVQLSQGQQHNLLYYLTSSTDSTVPAVLPADMGNTTRNVTILVTGSPRSLDSLETVPVQVSHSSQDGINEFESQWNCSLDVRPLFTNAATAHPRDSIRIRTSTIPAI